MKNTQTITGTVRHIERMPSSRNGNPRYRIGIDTGAASFTMLRTKPDSSIGYSVQNLRDGDMITATVRDYRGHLSIDHMERF